MSASQPAPLQKAGQEPDVIVPPRYFDVAIADSNEAVEAVRKHLAANAAPQNVDVRAVRALTSGEIVALKLKAGAIRPA